MRIRKLRLFNGYKRFHDLTIDLGDDPKRIVALVGQNGCGKSSVLDGMLYHAHAYGHLGEGGPRTYEYHSMNSTPGFNYQSVTIDFAGGPFTDVYQRREKDGSAKTLFSFRSPYRYNQRVMVEASRAVPEIRLNNYGASVSSDIDSKMTDNYLRLQAIYTKYLHDTDCKPSEARAKIIGDLNSSIKQCLDLELSSLGNIEASQGTLYFTKPDTGRMIEFNVLSSGEKEVVDILLDLYLRKTVYNDTIFLIDEPELHISTSIQAKLLNEINRLVGPNCQIWVATHSIGFLRALQENFADDSQLIYFPPGVPWGSTVQVLRPNDKSARQWKEIFGIALDDLVHLVSPKRLVYCEGYDKPKRDGKEKGLDAQVYNTVFNKNHSDTLFVSSGGNTELDQRSEIAISILSKVFPTLEILVLKDRDFASGKQTSKHDRDLYLQNNPKTHRILERWELENYLFDKEVLVKYCSQNGLSFNEVAYNAFVKDIENDNLKDRVGHIRNFCSIVGSISADQFKVNLAACITPEMGVYKKLEDCIFI